MTDAYFVEKAYPPEADTLRNALGPLYPVYKETLQLVEGFDLEWKYYGRRIGWQLKASRKGKALFYLTPLQQSFRIGMAIRETEREELMRSSLPASVKKELKSAKRYPEGYPLRLLIARPSHMKSLHIVFELLKDSR
jgi:hypothetical protein